MKKISENSKFEGKGTKKSTENQVRKDYMTDRCFENKNEEKYKKTRDTEQSPRQALRMHFKNLESDNPLGL